MKNPRFAIKTLILAGILFLESMLLTKSILNYVAEQSFFAFNLNHFIRIFLAMILLAFTYPLTIGAWKKFLKFLIVPLPIAAGMYFVGAQINQLNAFTGAYIAFIILSYDVNYASRVINNQIKFNPRQGFSRAIRGLFTVFILFSAILVISYSSADKIESTVLERVTNLTKNVTGRVIDGDSFAAGLFNLDVVGVVSNQIMEFLEPYRAFFKPVIALIVMAWMQLLAWVSYLTYIYLVGIVFWVAKKLKFVKTTVAMIEKEEIVL